MFAAAAKNKTKKQIEKNFEPLLADSDEFNLFISVACQETKGRRTQFS